MTHTHTHLHTLAHTRTDAHWSKNTQHIELSIKIENENQIKWKSDMERKEQQGWGLWGYNADYKYTYICYICFL